MRLFLTFLLLRASTANKLGTPSQSLRSDEKTNLKLVDSSLSNVRGQRARNLNGKKTAKEMKHHKMKGKNGKKSSGKNDGALDEPETEPSELRSGCDAPISLVESTEEDRAAFRLCFGYDEKAKTECDAGESFEQSCKYTYSVFSHAYECNCTVKSNVELFRKVDTNGDNNGSAEEIRAFLDDEPCVFPFTYKNYLGVEATYTSCITEDESSGHAWCSIKTNAKGEHIPSFYKYCTEEGMDYFGELILSRFDQNSDGVVSFEELISKEQGPSRKLATNPSDCGNDCNPLPERCVGQLAMADPECRNSYKTVPLGDEELLRILGDAQKQSYDVKQMYDTQEITYLESPIKRYEMGNEDWLSQIDAKAYDPLPDYSYAACLLMWEPPTNLSDFFLRKLAAMNPLTSVIQTLTAVYCNTQLFYYEEIFAAVQDGIDSIQWSLYTIEDGEHAGETVLSYMGTDMPTNAEQVVADVWGLPYAKPMMYNMVLEAAEIARQLNPTYITGHSLGGFIAQGVCTETGIPGASFGSVGGHDPFSADVTIFQNNYHHNVPFEVVMNNYDIVARTVSSMEGSECSYITSSCNVRWLWFDPLDIRSAGVYVAVGGVVGGLLGGSTGALLGAGAGAAYGGAGSAAGENHAASNYAMEVNQDHSRGWSTEIATGDPNLVQLPGVSLNKRCDFCFKDIQCEEGLDCNGLHCGRENAQTYCPEDSAVGASANSYCTNQKGCSGYCDDDGRCQFEKADVEPCWDNFECASGRCVWWTSYLSYRCDNLD
mmetsp:Transcript_7215/g.8228  ORF Transcript_7215/g.8228 Transcript_7215/m.8228 type:complete len:770 (+) Transcript_7215:86-2395(+)|eukprot:CAMPEP_0194129710 /NCGR_PEP_ID=MMETSP0152-20130528/921_1 /TAXON_ID=1049557 /ORGANISM="Thalassiothrix antarctica, Strain L6-D1" /LENGTH=769 /DNA_ID=CAMNT_0038824031 /DNA_START=25 /DNA_END=2334 /DNA_ORIENTATION=-